MQVYVKCVGLCEIECNYLSSIECGFVFDEVECGFDLFKNLIYESSYLLFCLCEFDVWWKVVWVAEYSSPLMQL